MNTTDWIRIIKWYCNYKLNMNKFFTVNVDAYSTFDTHCKHWSARSQAGSERASTGVIKSSTTYLCYSSNVVLHYYITIITLIIYTLGRWFVLIFCWSFVRRKDIPPTVMPRQRLRRRCSMKSTMPISGTNFLYFISYHSSISIILLRSL